MGIKYINIKLLKLIRHLTHRTGRNNQKLNFFLYIPFQLSTSLEFLNTTVQYIQFSAKYITN